MKTSPTPAYGVCAVKREDSRLSILLGQIDEWNVFGRMLFPRRASVTTLFFLF